jgi:hypothetical protein
VDKSVRGDESGTPGNVPNNIQITFLRKTKHAHNPLDDVRGNAEAFLEMSKEYGLKIDLS